MVPHRRTRRATPNFPTQSEQEEKWKARRASRQGARLLEHKYPMKYGKMERKRRDDTLVRGCRCACGLVAGRLERCGGAVAYGAVAGVCGRFWRGLRGRVVADKPRQRKQLAVSSGNGNGNGSDPMTQRKPFGAATAAQLFRVSGRGDAGEKPGQNRFRNPAP